MRTKSTLSDFELSGNCHRIRMAISFLGLEYTRVNLDLRKREMAEIQQWLSFSVNEMFNGPAMARAMVIFNRDFDAKRACACTDTTLDHLEFRLKDHDRLALDRFTPADIACSPYAALIHEGHVSLDAFPSIRASIKRVEALPGYVSMPGLPFPG